MSAPAILESITHEFIDNLGRPYKSISYIHDYRAIFHPPFSASLCTFDESLLDDVFDFVLG